MILGKFLPPHRGHQFLVEFARQYVERLHVLVCSLERDPIPGELRYRWMRQMFPDVRVVHVTDENPQEPQEHPEFWSIWRETVQRAVGEPLDYVFASEPYGWKLAEVLGAAFVPVDLARELVPVSGTAIRNDPMRYWEFLPEPVRPFFLKRICVFGPELTGKSTLARDLAKHFHTLYVWEYARPLLDPHGGKCYPEDIPRIVRGQLAAEEALALQANRVVFCDTDALTTVIWSDSLFGHVPAWVREVADSRTYDLYLLLDVDVPWVADGQRFFEAPEKRQVFFERCRQELEARGRRYVILRGSWPERFAAACRAVKQLLGDHRPAATGSER
jgi:NadR type nicotinamide-nucleotide adenylyltransferase